MVQILWGLVNNANVDYADLIWEEFKYQITSKNHDNLDKRSDSMMHSTKEDEVLAKLKFVSKGESTRMPKYGKPIPDVMLSEEIKASANYALELVMSVSLEKHRKRKEELRTKERHASLSLLDLKKGSRASREESILQQIPKGKGEGSGVVLDIQAYRDADRRYSVLVYGKEQEQPTFKPHNPTLACASEVPLGMNMDVEASCVLLQVQDDIPADKARQKKNDSTKAIMQKLVDNEQMLNALSPTNIADSNEEYVQENLINEVKNQLPKCVPNVVSDFIKPILERTDAGESSSRKDKAHQESSNYEKFVDAGEPRQEQEAPTEEIDPEESELQEGSTIMFAKKMKGFLKKDKITRADLKGSCYLVITDKIDWVNPEGNTFHNDLSKPLPLEGPPVEKTIPTRYFFNNDLEYLNHGNKQKNYALLLSKIKATRYEEEGIEERISYL
ncbi:hypothetical protein Tco_0257548 [Tanacetum coccineum]